MKIIAKDRQMGKTTYLINKALSTGYPLVVMNEMLKRQIERDYGDNIRVFTLSEFMSGGYKKYHSKILIDELDLVIEQYLGVQILETTFTGDIDIETVENVPIVVKQEIRMKR